MLTLANYPPVPEIGATVRFRNIPVGTMGYAGFLLVYAPNDSDDEENEEDEEEDEEDEDEDEDKKEQ